MDNNLFDVEKSVREIMDILGIPKGCFRFELKGEAGMGVEAICVFRITNADIFFEERINKIIKRFKLVEVVDDKPLEEERRIMDPLNQTVENGGDGEVKTASSQENIVKEEGTTDGASGPEQPTTAGTPVAEGANEEEGITDESAGDSLPEEKEDMSSAGDSITIGPIGEDPGLTIEFDESDLEEEEDGAYRFFSKTVDIKCSGCDKKGTYHLGEALLRDLTERPKFNYNEVKEVYACHFCDCLISVNRRIEERVVPGAIV